MFDAEHKNQIKEVQFPKDCAKAYDSDQRLVRQ